MKKRIIGFVLTCMFMVSASVGFAYNGPPTTPCEFDVVISDDTSITITTNVVESQIEYTITLERSGETYVVDVGKNTEDSSKYNSNEFALPSYFLFSMHVPDSWPRYNEWMIFKYELDFKLPYEPVTLDRRDNTRQLC